MNPTSTPSATCTEQPQHLASGTEVSPVQRWGRWWWGSVLLVSAGALLTGWSATWFTLFSAEAGNREYLLAAGAYAGSALALAMGSCAALPREEGRLTGAGAAQTALVLSAILVLTALGTLLQATEPLAGLSSTSLMVGAGIGLLPGAALVFLGGWGIRRRLASS